MKRAVIILWSIFCLVGMVQSQDGLDEPIVFIADASSTMEKVIYREAKIDIVKSVTMEWREYVSPTQPVGLVAYGHRDRHDCDDIELLVDFDSTDPIEFTKAIDKLKPYGRTPLASSVSYVLETLRKTEEVATLILLTDGIETCGGTICEVVENALADGLEFRLHIVGFDLKNKDRSTLECAAHATGGLYVDAEDRNELTAALSLTRSLNMHSER